MSEISDAVYFYEEQINKKKKLIDGNFTQLDDYLKSGNCDFDGEFVTDMNVFNKGNYSVFSFKYATVTHLVFFDNVKKVFFDSIKLPKDRKFFNISAVDYYAIFNTEKESLSLFFYEKKKNDEDSWTRVEKFKSKFIFKNFIFDIKIFYDHFYILQKDGVLIMNVQDFFMDSFKLVKVHFDFDKNLESLFLQSYIKIVSYNCVVFLMGVKLVVLKYNMQTIEVVNHFFPQLDEEQLSLLNPVFDAEVCKSGRILYVLVRNAAMDNKKFFYWINHTKSGSENRREIKKPTKCDSRPLKKYEFVNTLPKSNPKPLARPTSRKYESSRSGLERYSKHSRSRSRSRNRNRSRSPHQRRDKAPTNHPPPRQYHHIQTPPLQPPFQNPLPIHQQPYYSSYDDYLAAQNSFFQQQPAYQTNQQTTFTANSYNTPSHSTSFQPQQQPQQIQSYYTTSQNF